MKLNLFSVINLDYTLQIKIAKIPRAFIQFKIKNIMNFISNYIVNGIKIIIIVLFKMALRDKGSGSAKTSQVTFWF